MIEKLIEHLKAARTVPQLAQATAALLRACGIYNYQALGLELARMSVTNSHEGGH